MNTEKRFWRTSHLLAAGMTRHGITRAVQKKELFKVVHGVWSTREPTDEIRLGCLAATRPGLVYTAETAAFLYGLTDLSWPGTAKVPRGTSHDGGGLLRLSTGASRRSRVLRDIPLASPLETAVELSLPDSDLRTFLQEQYCGVTGNDVLAEDLAALPPKRRGRAAELLDGLITGTASHLELRAVTAVIGALDGIDVEVTVNGMVEGYRFDIVIPDADVVIEIDSFAYHGEGGTFTTEDSHLKERWKKNAAARFGWTVLSYTDRCIDFTLTYTLSEIVDTVRYNLRYPRTRRKRTDEDRIRTDSPVHTWNPLLL
ncbi:hypothetical protein [uncultured Corynebacterium sp.]|uniref:hypothetical protein n=1 Tax=uncultured Corynebacterium sp. TaxID=159447 RepID=UPI0025F2B329|nr:hypothetical protein [uncultured Corynebacterium sp.]